jgi:DNA-binding MarR family transcriptional regulator
MKDTISKTRSTAASQPTKFGISLRIVRLSNLLSKPFFTRYAERFDLSLNEWRVMAMLSERPRIAATDVSVLTGMHPMNVSRSVRRLARMGRITRSTNSADRRRTCLELTPVGAAIVRKVAPGAVRREQLLEQALGPAGTRAFNRLLDQVIVELEALGAED